MLKPDELLNNVLLNIENGIRDDIRVNDLARQFKLSPGHLQRLFRFAFKQTLAGYMRSRRLAESLDDLLKTNSNILDIALNYGFGYEQSYIRAFKNEFGITPGELRKSRQIVKVKPPIFLFDENRLSDGVIFGPDIVMVPQFHIAGNSHRIPFNDSITLAPELAKHFWKNDRAGIKNAVNPNVYIGLTCNINCEEKCSDYITAVQVKNEKNFAQGYKRYTFRDSLCARFRYIGQHHYYELNRNIMKAMYNAIEKYSGDGQAKYILLNDRIYFEKIDTSLYDGRYCQMEWFTPVADINNPPPNYS
ncbi:MAG: helix-turn-helix domain-containing protein [Treponema sp.]|nr:helix-turn-helix domain-containing protein [Treponema sp.]